MDSPEEVTEDEGSILDHLPRKCAAFSPTDHLTILDDGRQYLEVCWRLVWLRKEHPAALTETTLKRWNGEEAIVFARVEIPGHGSATGWGRETVKRSGNNVIEVAETKALGRALAALGYGTQFAGRAFELDPPRIMADSPLDALAPVVQKPASASQDAPGQAGTFVRYKDTGKDREGAEERKHLPLTDPQCKLIYDLVLETGLEREALEDWIRDLYGDAPRPGLGVNPSKPEHLSRAQASELIGHLQQRRRDRKA